MIPDSLPVCEQFHWYSKYFFGEPPFMLTTAFFEQNYHFNLHMHDFYEINIIIKGRSVHYINNMRFEVQENMLFVIPPGYIHGYFSIEETDLYNFILHKDFFVEYKNDLSRMIGYPFLLTTEPIYSNSDDFRYYFKLTDQQMDQLIPVLSSISDTHKAHQPESGVMMNALGLCAVTKICSFYREWCAPSFNPLTAGGILTGVFACTQYISEHYGEEITIDHLCRLSAMSRATLFRNFNKYTGSSPIEYLYNFRLIKTREHLQSTNMTLLDIAQNCGFYDSAHFCNKFRTKYHMTPFEYRKMSYKANP